MSDWLQLTEDDIARLEDVARAQPPTPAVLTIHTADLPPDAPAPPRRDHVLRLTVDDLTAVGAIAEADPDLARLETLMFGLTNSARQAELPRWLGGPTVRWHAELAAVARGHSADMLKRGYVDHATPEGTTVSDRLNRHGIKFMACGENIGVVYGPASLSDAGIYEIYDAFMRQPRRLTNHRGNLLNPIWTHVGIGIARDPNGTLFMTQNFATVLAE